MDSTDMKLLLLLSSNCRLPYADLAESLNLSVNAVHKRIQQLIAIGVIKAFTAKPSLFAAKAIVVFISGTSQLPSTQDLPTTMKAHDSVYWLAIGGGKYLYIGAYLRSLTELTSLITSIQTEAKILEPTIGILATPPYTTAPATATLSVLDRRIIRFLKDNARKPIIDVADDLRVSAKTIRRRLTHMMQHYLIELSIEWYPDKSNDIITLIDLHLAPDATTAIAPALVKKYAPNVIFYWTFANLPFIITFVTWTNNMNDLQTLRGNLEKEPGVASIVPNILYTGYIFDTWRDRLIEP